MRRRVPWLTAAVVLVTTATSVWSISDDAALARMGRNADAYADGEWWRIVTSLFAQDGGVAGTFSNLIFLVALGTLAEWSCGRRRWLIAYFGTGVATQFVGMAGWQPEGAGNSVANCGLAALLAVWMWRGGRTAQPATSIVVGLWVVAVVSGALANGIVTVLACAAVVTISNLFRSQAARIIPALLVAGAIALCVAENIHGAALAIGLLIAIPASFVGKVSERSDR